MLKNRQHDIAWHALASRGFIAALALLILNDHIFKAAFHNWLTGKLSDFAGLFVFVVFWCAMLPKRHREVMLASAAGFVLWKSPLSEPLIALWNAQSYLPWARVVDYTDLSAIVTIPFAAAYCSQAKQRNWSASIGKPLMALAMLSMLASAMPPPPRDDEPHEALGITFPGGNLGRCVEENAAQNNWKKAKQVTTLDCSDHYGSLHNLDGIENLKNLTTFNASGNDIGDIAPLTKLVNLQHLDLSRNMSLSSISELSKTKELIWVDISYTNTTSLTGLENATKLQYLAARGAILPSLEGANALKALETLILSRAQIENFGEPIFLETLKGLDLESSVINGDASFLSRTKNLETLNLANAKITTDYTFIKNLAALREVNLSGLQISDASNVSQLKALKKVNLALNKLSITPAFTSQEIVRLDLSQNAITSIEPIGQLTSLEELILTQNQIADVRPLASLRQLKYLDLATNKIINVSPLQFLPALDTLMVSGNPINDYTPLADHVKRASNVVLNSDDCENQILHAELAPKTTLSITRCTNVYTRIGALTQLTELILGVADDGNLNFLKSLTNLRTLKINYTSLPNLEFLAGTNSLKILSLANSTITDLTPIAKLSTLRSLEFDATVEEQTVPSLASLMNLTQVTIHRCLDAKAWEEKLHVATVDCRAD